MTYLTDCTEYEQGGMRIFAARTGAKDVVSLEGSVLGGSHYLPSLKHLVPDIAAGLLDADTKRHSKEELRGLLAERGASLSFTADKDRTYFRATCLPEDLAFMCRLIAECLGEATFKTTEIENERSRRLGDLREAETETGDQAERTFLRQVFDSKHINYASTFREDAARLKSVTRADLLGFQKLFGRDGLVVSLVGDLQPEAALRAASQAFSKLPAGAGLIPLSRNSKAAQSDEILVPVLDKASIDVFFGASVPLTRDDERYLPFAVLTDMLGGGGIFTGHLMRTIRERDGLTYGIYARPYGFGTGTDGALRIWAAFSPDTYDKAVATTRKEVRKFFKDGITAEALAVQQDHIAGTYAVGLSTTRGLAAMLHKIGREGKSLAYIDSYPSLIRAVTVDALREAASLVDPDTFTLAAAGTFRKK